RDALLVAHRLRHRLAEGDAHVLDRVVAVDVEVALGVDLEVDQRVAGDVVEEADAGRQRRVAAAVEVDPDADLRLLRVAADVGGAVHVADSRAASIWSFSSGVPTVRRRQFASSGCSAETFFTRT